jgi:hypothetical protein
MIGSWWRNRILLGIVAYGVAATGAADDSPPAIPVSGQQAAVEPSLPALAELLDIPTTRVRRCNVRAPGRLDR